MALAVEANGATGGQHDADPRLGAAPTAECVPCAVAVEEARDASEEVALCWASTAASNKASLARGGLLIAASSAPLDLISRAMDKLGTRVVPGRGAPVRGLVQWFRSQRSIASRSKTSPSIVLTGSVIKTFEMGQ